MRGTIKAQKHAHQNEFIRTIKLRRIASGGPCTLCCIHHTHQHTWCYNTSTRIPEQNCEMSKNLLLLMHLSPRSWSILWSTIIYALGCRSFQLKFQFWLYMYCEGWRDIAKYNAVSMCHVEIWTMERVVHKLKKIINIPWTGRKKAKWACWEAVTRRV